MKAKGEFWRDGGLIYFVAGKNVFAARPTDVADVRSGYLQGRWESTVEQWNKFADALGRPKVTLSSLRDRIALAAVRRELAGDDLILWGRLDPSDPYIKLTDNVSRAEQKRWESKGYQVRVVAAGKRPDNV